MGRRQPKTTSPWEQHDPGDREVTRLPESPRARSGLEGGVESVNASRSPHQLTPSLAFHHVLPCP